MDVQKLLTNTAVTVIVGFLGSRAGAALYDAVDQSLPAFLTGAENEAALENAFSLAGVDLAKQVFAKWL